jgi:hypothetical protein
LVLGAGHGGVILLDPSYYGYLGCSCAEGETRLTERDDLVVAMECVEPQVGGVVVVVVGGGGVTERGSEGRWYVYNGGGLSVVTRQTPRVQGGRGGEGRR